jgi:hypothetical protein
MSRLPTPMSKSLAEATQKSRLLFRQLMRVCSHSIYFQQAKFTPFLMLSTKLAPQVIMNYELGYTVPQVRSRIREEFQKHRALDDPATIDFLVFLGRNELMELQEQWKTRSHVVRYFAPQKKEEPDLLKSFFDGN